MSSPTIVNVFGPPGSGKTTKLTELFVRAVRETGSPDRVAAVTYTKAAAQELRVRAGAALGIKGTPESLKRALPWVGTIHALAYRILGHPKLVGHEGIQTFKESALSGVAPSTQVRTRAGQLDSADTPLWDPVSDPDPDEVTLALRLHASAKHRLSTLTEALETLPREALARSSADRLRSLCADYKQWKKEQGLIDYEDLLDAGSHREIPVSVILADEVQDNSPLLWKALDAWMARCRLVICAGDPWQALYVYAGASPAMFRSRPGKWVSLGKSHRLSPGSVDYAKLLLREGGWDDPLIDSWRGVGGEPRDGTTLYLARTHTLVKSVERDLIDQGIPFSRLSGKAPLEQKSAVLYRLLGRLQEHQTVEAGRLREAAGASVRSIVPKQAPDDEPITGTDVEREAGCSIEHVKMRLPWADYFRQVEITHGSKALSQPSRNRVGTVHSAKGREADRVILLRAWGWIPGRAASEGASMEEALVAYVAATRHRLDLEIVTGLGGIPYPFP